MTTPSGDDVLGLLTGPDATDLLAAAVETTGGRLLTWSATEVDHRPGHSTTVAYRARARWAGDEREISLGASTGLGPADTLPPGVVALSDGARDVAVWQFPQDPWLPALPGALDPGAVGDLLGSLGVRTNEVRTSLRRYRPGRRAVVEVRSGPVTAYLKVLPPGEAEPLHDRHRLLTSAGLPTPDSLGWNAEGLLVLAGLPGVPMRQRLRERSPHVPSGPDLLAMLRRLPEAARSLPAPRSWSDDVAYYARVVGAALPSESGRITDLAGIVETGLAHHTTSPDIVHGDLYEGQLLLGGPQGGSGGISGLLDIDTVGPGRLSDDLACLLGHLVVQVQAEPAHEATTLRLAHAWLESFEQAVDPVELRLRTAGVILSLTPGPHRVQEDDWPRVTRDRIDAAGSWVRSAQRLAGLRT